MLTFVAKYMRCLQLNGAWQVHNAGLAPLHKQATVLKKQFDSFRIDHIFRWACSHAPSCLLPFLVSMDSQWCRVVASREANGRADQLSNVAMDGHGWTGLKDGQVMSLLLCCLRSVNASYCCMFVVAMQCTCFAI